MDILVDTRERGPLTFQFVDGVTVKSECLNVGDYTARHNDGKLDDTVIERKSIADLFGAFSRGYENEKAKIARAKEAGLRYVLAIEGTIFDVLEGYKYHKAGEDHYSKKDGMSQVKQLMTLTKRRDFEIWWTRSRREMAFLIQEFFLAQERINAKK